MKVRKRNETRRQRVATATCAFIFLNAAAGVATAEHTRRWRQSTYDEFLKGTTHGIAVRSDGRLELAPKFTQLADADASYLWSVKLDAKGTPYASGGSPAKVFKLGDNGKATTMFESSELSAQAIAFDSQGTLYVATSPDGKVYRVSASGEKSVFFDPKTKYIWDLAFGPDGTLYVATGDKGQIYSVTSAGKGELFYASDEAHIRVLAFDAKGNVIAGTEPSGRVLRLTRSPNPARKSEKEASAEGFVLYETPKREVTALTIGRDGSIYAAAIGERAHNAAVAPSTTGTSTTTTTVTSTGNVTVIAPVQSTGQPQTPFIPFPAAISSGVYKIAPDGAPEELWTSREDVVYSLGIGSDGRLLAGLGNTGALLAIDGHGVFAQLAKAGSAQITGIARNPAGKVFLCTANPGKLISLGPEYEPEGTYESRSFDAQLFSQWGRMEWWSPPALAAGKSNSNSRSGEPRLEFYIRTGNTEEPGKEWSKWFGPYSASGAETEAPPARFAQWKTVIHDGRPGDGIEWVSLAYQPKNVAPVIDGIMIQDPGVRAQGQPALATGAAPVVQLKFPPTPPSSGIVVNQSQSGGAAKFEPPPQGTAQKGYQSVLWTAHDDNEDELKYAVYFRGEDEREWKLLKDNLDQRFYSFDTTTLADGAYYLKIAATDAPSNPPDKTLKTERESERFEVDNTPPAISKIEASVSSGAAQVKFTATDATSSIDRAQYSVDGGDWTLVSPKSGISDGKQESYDFALRDLKPGEHTIALRAYDRFENVGTGKTVVKIM